MNIRSLLNTALEPFQVQLYRTNRKCLGLFPFRDLRRLCKSTRPIIIDCGANRGQTIEKLCKQFRAPVIHAFEPSVRAFRQLASRYGNYADIHLLNSGLGNVSMEREFYEGETTEISSYLPFGVDALGPVRDRMLRPITTLEDYCGQHGITHVDILKSDTQGFELEVLKGAGQIIDEGRIHLVYLELIFNRMYEGLPSLDEIYRYLSERGYKLVCFYQFGFDRQCAHTTDALFIHPNFAPDESRRQTGTTTHGRLNRANL